ncbi:MAG: Gfo/Idh/MocA family oxidoreductase [Armatimonadetes bacterium]|nr:Gfo/Idh/MocA family oxidoreductase [Armatimonadota bacterium]
MSDQEKTQGLSRRDFIKSSTVSAAGAAAVMASGNYAYAAATDKIRVGLIGCGGRGTGAAGDVANAAPGVEIVAMGDVFPGRVNGSRNELKKLGDKFKVTDATAYSGLDAYKRVIDTNGVNYIILATPPGFRPLHLDYAIKAGKHVFMEKPVAVDPTGVRSALASSDLANQKKLGIVAGTQRRHQNSYRETMQRIKDGAIGDVTGGQVYWNQGGLWSHQKQANESDTEWQIRNWLYFTWLSGDHIVEQHVHNIDVANWAMKGHPIRATGVGGRQTRTSPEYGHIYDHFAVELEYPNGARILSMCRQ